MLTWATKILLLTNDCSSWISDPRVHDTLALAAANVSIKSDHRLSIWYHFFLVKSYSEEGLEWISYLQDDKGWQSFYFQTWTLIEAWSIDRASSLKRSSLMITVIYGDWGHCVLYLPTVVPGSICLSMLCQLFQTDGQLKRSLFYY